MQVEKGNWSLIRLGNLIPNAKSFREDPPLDRGKFGYDRKGALLDWHQFDPQVKGSFARYNYPKFRTLHYEIKNTVEKVIGEKLYPTYYYDRFYFKGHDLKPHKDRESCEISVSMHISTNADYDWPIYFMQDDETVSVPTGNPGDAVLYKGCELEHWREPFEGNVCGQVFLHYNHVDGPFAQKNILDGRPMLGIPPIKKAP